MFLHNGLHKQLKQISNNSSEKIFVQEGLEQVGSLPSPQEPAIYPIMKQLILVSYIIFL
jgi:hypothetical protein